MLVSVSAPGADVLPWDDRRELVQASHRYGWNSTASARYARLTKAAQIAADRYVRRMGHKGPMPRRVAVVWALQKRGVWHVHEALPAATPVEVLWSRQVVRFIDNARKREERMGGQERRVLLELERRFGVAARGFYGWGFIDRNPLRARAADAAYANEARAAAYLARNVAGYLGENASNPETAVGRRLRSYVSRRLTRETGCTMRNLRRARFLYVVLRDGLPWPEKWSDEDIEILGGLLDRGAELARGP